MDNKPVVIGNVIYPRERITQIDDPFQRRLIALYPFVYRFALSLHRNATAAEDLAQTVMLKAHKGRAGFDMDTNMQSWLARITKNAFYNEKKKKTENQLDDDFEDPARATKANQEDYLVLKQVVQEIMPLLSDEHAQVIGLMVFMGCEQEKAAEIMKCSIITVRTRLHRAREKIMSIMENDVGVHPALLGQKPSRPELERKLGQVLNGYRAG